MDADSLHRLEKMLADSGEAGSFAEAEKIFSKYGVRIVIGDDVANDPVAHVIALTAINCAARSFKGNVQIEAPKDMELAAPGFINVTLETFLSWLSIKPVESEHSKNWPMIAIGKKFITEPLGDVIRPWADGWDFGLGPGVSTRLFAPAAVAAAALAVSEAFSILRNDNPYAGKRAIKQSLWSIDQALSSQPPVDSIRLPGCWLVGLGHLGQAYAWTMGFMQPANDAMIYLQDIDFITKSTLSTSMLSIHADIDTKKTRKVAHWLEARGYQVSLIERRFDEHQRIRTEEPSTALFGVDNPAARRVLEKAGYRYVIDAGLGSGYKDFRAIRIRTFPGPSSAALLWASSEVVSDNLAAPAYQNLLKTGAQQCGVTTLSSRAVGAPFVGCFASAYVLAELIRKQIIGSSHACIDINLKSPQKLEAISN